MGGENVADLIAETLAQAGVNGSTSGSASVLRPGYRRHVKLLDSVDYSSVRVGPDKEKQA
jgi:hypothetical protein